MGASSIALGSSFFDILRQTDIKNLRAFCDYLAEKLYICTRQTQNNEEDGSNDDNNDRPKEADFENGKMGKSSQVVHRSA